jgi:hypothetical protein
MRETRAMRRIAPNSLLEREKVRGSASYKPSAMRSKGKKRPCDVKKNK